MFCVCFSFFVRMYQTFYVCLITPMQSTFWVLQVFCQAGPSQGVDCSAPTRIKRKMSFPRTQQRIASSRIKPGGMLICFMESFRPSASSTKHLMTSSTFGKCHGLSWFCGRGRNFYRTLCGVQMFLFATIVRNFKI